MRSQEIWDYGVVFCCFCFYTLLYSSEAQMPGFVSFDCGSTSNFTDEIGLEWTSDSFMTRGQTARISVPGEERRQYRTLRYFPADANKYCYTLTVVIRQRYLIRSTFLYGSFLDSNVFPEFDVSFGATYWSTVTIFDVNNIEVVELVFLATDTTVSVCLSNATTGMPFISTLELRQFNESAYYTPYENQFFLKVAARINFGAESNLSVRYPDDPFDRIWESDTLKKADYLVGMAPGTERISTRVPISAARWEWPPQKVLQTAVVGRNGSLTYRLNLHGFPGFGCAAAYLAEIEDLRVNTTRKFRLIVPDLPQMSIPVININENRGKFSLYEPGSYNVSLPFVLSFSFEKTPDSTLGPILNALEISRFLKKRLGTSDGPILSAVIAAYSSADWAREGGDPCIPSSWSWVQCSSDTLPRITTIKLSGKNLSGQIPLDFTKLDGLVELWLDGNFLSGSIPDFSGCHKLRVLHLENNELAGNIPSSLADLATLRELYVQNNRLRGNIPSRLLNESLFFNYSGNPELHIAKSSGGIMKEIIIGASIGGAVLIVAIISASLLLHLRKKKKKMKKKKPKEVYLSESAAEAAHYFTLSEIVEATNNFERMLGVGGYGIVYFGRLKDGKEIAAKLLKNDSIQGKHEFVNEISLLSKIHHRNLVKFLGYCQEDDKSILVYEFMCNGTVREHLRGGGGLTWMQRLEIAEDAAKGIEYLHAGCVPSIIHRDVKTTNILLDQNMRGKVSDFGISKLTADGDSHIFSIVRGTPGYLDPEYYISQRLTLKSDIYSFGVVLLELISGQLPISRVNFGINCGNIVDWARMHVENGDIQAIIDPELLEYDIHSMWSITELALKCLRPQGSMRPFISEVIKDIHDAMVLLKGADSSTAGTSDGLCSGSYYSRDVSISGPVSR